jgi:hypothetical protein
MHCSVQHSEEEEEDWHGFLHFFVAVELETEQLELECFVILYNLYIEKFYLMVGNSHPF